MDRKKIFNVKNRSASTVVVRVPDLGIRREFAPGESVRMTFEELEKLSYQPGGRELMANFLQIMEDEVNDELGIHRENEYYMSEAQIAQMLKSGSLEQFKDCLDYAPIGVIDLVKQIAVQLPLTDTVKIRVLKEKTGFDTEKAIMNAEAENAPEENSTKEETKPATATGRRTNTNYRVVNKTKTEG